MLSLTIFFPLVGAALLLVVSNGEGERDGPIRQIALATSIFTFGVSLKLWLDFDPAGAEFQFVERHPWIPAFGIDYFLGIDGISLMLILLTTFLTPLALLSSCWSAASVLPPRRSFP